uniref:Calmodulin-lysine N-methyltransferase n=1 Tax=Chlamydomonas euryale TaxID=1486919 RepID=A0A7R9VQG3_9CHLO
MGDADGPDADECLFVAAIVASERVAAWVDAIRAGRKSAVVALRDALRVCPEAYAEEARKAGVVNELTRLLGRTADEEVMDAAASIITACSGHMACGGKLRRFEYGGVSVAIREGMLGDGLGAKVWSTAHVMAMELVRAPHLVTGKRVLELGAGCGLNGIVAAKVGAAEVVLTDVEAPVLRLLAECVSLNASRADAGMEPGAGAGAGAETQASERGVCVGKSNAPRMGRPVRERRPTDVELFDDAEEVDGDAGLDALFGDGKGTGYRHEDASNGSAGGSRGNGDGNGDGNGNGNGIHQHPQPLPRQASKPVWDVGNMHVRLLDWGDALRELGQVSDGGGDLPEPPLPPVFNPCCGGEVDGDGDGDGALPPRAPAGARYDAVLANECMYEPAHARLVAAVLSQRLERGGFAIVCSAVRCLRTFRTFRAQCTQRGLRYRDVAIDLKAGGRPAGLTGRLSRDYEGGFVMIAIDHADAPFEGWHRDDFL